MQAIYNIAEICAQKGVENAVLSPGSRCAPLTIAFCRHTAIKEITVSDERSAGFIALGMALETNKPTVLVCTSGTAAMNYGPAIAEAFYQRIPLIVITADRPQEWVDQMDGQTIRQQGLHTNHTLRNYQLPVDNEHLDSKWHIERSINEALNIAIQEKGPVHINVPFREPFYAEGAISFESTVKTIDIVESTNELSQSSLVSLQSQLDLYERILIVPGQGRFLDLNLSDVDSPILADGISNIKGKNIISTHDYFVPNLSKEAVPQLVISFGKSIISKSLKLFLRDSNIEHWHISDFNIAADTYQSLSKVVRTSPEFFFTNLRIASSKEYNKLFSAFENQIVEVRDEAVRGLAYCEFKALHEINAALSEGSNLHLANSMAVRYFNYFSLPQRGIEVYANRGTSGIDGSSSTAVGVSMMSKKLNVLVTGDLSFFYDRNAFWQNYLPKNLKIVVMNNQGGGIFRMIPGPVAQPELEEYFVTKQSLNAKSTAKEFDIAYYAAQSDQELQQVLPKFFYEEEGLKILEVFTNGEDNTRLFKEHLKDIRNQLH